MMLRPAIVILGLLLAGQALAQSSTRIVCWTDSQGRRACGNTVPPQYAAQERRYYNQQGVVVETRRRQLTDEELRSEAEARSAQTQSLEEARRQQAYDKFLLDTYRDVGELESQRDRRLADLRGREQLAEQSLSETQRALGDLRGRRDSLQTEGQPVPARLNEQIASFSQAEAEHSGALEALRGQMEELRGRYERDIERYRQLRGQGAVTD